MIQKQRFTQQTDKLTVRGVQSQIVDAVLVVANFIGLIGLFSVMVTMTRLGWRNESLGFVIVMSVIIVTTLLRKHLPYAVKTSILIGMIFATGVTNLIGWGLLGSSSIWFILAVLLTMILHDLRRGLVVYALVVMAIGIITLLVRLEVLTYALDFEGYALDPVSWLSRMVMIIFVCAMLVASVGRVIDVLQDQLEKTRKTASELEDRTDALMLEVQKREEAEKALATALIDLKDLDHLKDQFIDSVSHELRTPIANLQLYHQLLGMKPERADSYLETLSSETERLHYIVEQMLHASSDSFDMQLSTMVDIDVVQLMQVIMARYETEYNKKNLTVTIKSMDDPCITLAAPEHMTRALTNVIDNAIKYTVRDGTIIIDTIHMERDEQQVIEIMISNSGIRPTKRDAVNFFERFYRGETSLEMGVPGAGLGLPITQQILRKYGGSITFDYDESQAMMQFKITLLSVAPLSDYVADALPSSPSSL